VEGRDRRACLAEGGHQLTPPHWESIPRTPSTFNPSTGAAIGSSQHQMDGSARRPEGRAALWETLRTSAAEASSFLLHFCYMRPSRLL
jgi:hypothetical protein